MIRNPVPVLLLMSLFLAGASCGSPQETAAPEFGGLSDAFETDTLAIETDDGKRHNFKIYLAVKPEQQRRGLMFVRNLPADAGMLFVYEGSAIHSIWMKNTYIPLDLVFAFDDGKVSTVVHDTQPLSLKSLSSVVPVTYVLELNAGTARRLNINSNSRLIWSPGDG